MKHLLFLALLPIHGFAQTITYSWPDLDINPNSYPHCTDGSFIGRMAQWTGVEACVTKDAGARNYTSYGWPARTGTAQVRLACLAFKPLLLDSVVIIHRQDQDGPERIRISIVDGRNIRSVVADVEISQEYTALPLDISASIGPSADSEYEQVLILLEPYGGKGGAWDLRSVTIVATDLATIRSIHAEDPSELPASLTIPQGRLVDVIDGQR
jgi:hypothetical protein